MSKQEQVIPSPPAKKPSSIEHFLRCSEPKQSEIPCNFVFSLTDLVSSSDLVEAANGYDYPRKSIYFRMGRQPYPYLVEIARHIYRKARVARLSGPEAPAAIPANSLSVSSCSMLGGLDSSKSATEASRGEFKHLETRELLNLKAVFTRTSPVAVGRNRLSQLQISLTNFLSADSW